MIPNAFRTRIRASLADANLQTALDSSTERRLKLRATAMDTLPDLAASRQQARAVRAEVIANLDRYLDQFIANAQANGLIIHRAATAEQATQIALEICRAVGPAPRVIKSKSMVSEEIHLNAALEAAGMRVVETDLGEYIVQLRGEPPAHLITPAVHLRRQQVGQLFAEKLGVPYTEDIPTLTNTARKVLRQAFLEADVGISGVNFAVAETGTLAVLTNEGNGRMVTTLPKVHIALLGMERLLPAMDDLALMLDLLPRSATGQKMTVYASLVRGPRSPADAEGPLERHVIILDNGRRAIRQSPLAEALYCIRCGACLNACPVFRELGGHAYVSIHGEHAAYPGPIGSVISPALFGVDDFGHLGRASSLCGACKEHCPVDIDLPKLLLRVRTGVVAPAGGGVPPRPTAPRPLAWGLRLFSLIATHPRLYGLAQRLAGVGSRLLSPFSAWMQLPAFTGWGDSKDFPRPALVPFRERFRQSSTVNSPPVQPISPAPLPHIPSSLDSESLLDRFTQELTAIGGTVIACPAADLAPQILAQLAELGETRLQAWEAGLPLGLLDSLRAAGIAITHTADPSIKVGLTGATAASALTGTLLVPGGLGRPFTASLLPEIHLAVLSVHDLKQNLAQVLNLGEASKLPLAALISGPSRTGDIEMTLTIGVHGPGKVVVFCVS